ncbi:MAG TPA: DUF4131 domain-containing protein, partial [Candidatus Aminicenantes bacterium]|nr:DUF4131 domain-containing protein [Candidatus Aminicenantes bacterium]
MIFPLLLPALSFIFGLILALVSKSAFPSWLIFVLFLTLIAGWFFYFKKNKSLSLTFILGGFFACGFSLYSWQYQEFQNNPLHQLKADGYIDFKGEILKSPERRPDRDLLTIEISEVAIENRVEKMSGRLRLSIPHSTTSEKPLELLAGDQIDFSACLNSEESFRNFFPDFMPRYLRSQKIEARAYTKS